MWTQNEPSKKGEATKAGVITEHFLGQHLQEGSLLCSFHFCFPQNPCPYETE